MKLALEGSNAVAHIVNLCNPGVVSAYPITPQTHIVEDLAKLKADGKANYEFVRADSEFAAASIVLGSQAAGVRSYSATCSQGLLLMTEVIFAIAGLRLPVVMTIANRAISAPISIWNDQQDVMTVRDSGWLQLFGETVQECVDLHMIAFKVGEKTSLPVMVNMDGFVLTHTTEPVDIPDKEKVKKFVGNYNPADGTYLDPKTPKTFGAFTPPDIYMEIRQQLHEELVESKEVLRKTMESFKKIFKRDLDLVEEYKLKDAKVVFVTMGSVAGTVKVAIDKLREQGIKAGLLKVVAFRPFPSEEIKNALKNAKYIAVLDKSVSLGQEGVLAMEIKNLLLNNKVQSFIVGLGGRDVTVNMVKQISKIVQSKDNTMHFIGK